MWVYPQYPVTKHHRSTGRDVAGPRERTFDRDGDSYARCGERSPRIQRTYRTVKYRRLFVARKSDLTARHGVEWQLRASQRSRRNAVRPLRVNC